jgi:ABC-2 type transport system ATP-binding protein
MIEIKNIHKKFHQKTVLNGVDLSVSSGTIQALLGANGAGKSTLINILSFLIHKNKGKISIDGEELNVNSYKYRSKVGYVFEHPIYVDDFSAEQYLHFVGQLHKLERANYESKTEELLTFFSLPFDKKSIKNYSKGMKTKVSLAAALIHEPSYLVLDEPLDGMDFSSIQKTIELLKDLSKKNNCTILIASHQYDLI